MITITKMMITKMPMIAPMMPLFTVHLHWGGAAGARGVGSGHRLVFADRSVAV